MTGTLETTNNLILIKIKSLVDIANIIDKYKFINVSNKVEKLIIDLNEISDNYEMGSVKILSDYFLITQEYQNDIYNIELSKNIISNEELKNKLKELKNAHNIKNDEYFEKYQFFIKRDNYIDKINRYYILLKNITTVLFSNDDNFKYEDMCKIKHIFSIFENSTIIRNVSNNIYNKCKVCAMEMKIITAFSEIVCTYCGITEKLYGTVLEDEQFYYQEGQRSKHGSYDPSKHCRSWIERLQARESKEIPDKVLNDVRKYIKLNKIRNIDEISCKDIREYLSKTRHTSYNEHIPLIRKLITGRAPEQLHDNELQLIQIYFDKVIRIYDDIKPSNKSNVPYHPYLIYKIIEHILYSKPKDEFQKSKKRLFGVLSCIHLQARETLIENDRMWKKICNYIDEIEYRPTDKYNENIN
jgi:hypothetical protein